MKSAPRIPNVGEYVRGLGRLLKVEPSRPTQPPPDDYIFEKVSATIELRRKGKVLQQFSSYWDWLGEGSAVTAAIDDARKYIAREQITPESEVEIVVVRETGYHRARPHADPHIYDPAYRHFTPVDYGASWNVPETKREDVWTSRNPEARP